MLPVILATFLEPLIIGLFLGAVAGLIIGRVSALSRIDKAYDETYLKGWNDCRQFLFMEDSLTNK